jgi:pyrimidine deaminase RibD-like protein
VRLGGNNEPTLTFDEWEYALTPKESILKLSSLLLPSFPKAMGAPLVAAGVLRVGEQEFASTGTNVMQLQPVGHKIVHAEEIAIRLFSPQPNDEVDIVITLEPCSKRFDRQEKIDSCRGRIKELSQQCKLRQVVIGKLDNGEGVPFFLENNIRVVLLHGEKHERSVKDEAKRHLPTWKASSLFQILTPTELDPLTLLSLERRTQENKDKEESLAEVIKVVHQVITSKQDPSVALLRSFPQLFTQSDAGLLKKRIEEVKSLTTSLEGNLLKLLLAYIDPWWWRRMRANTENELREKVQVPHVP